MSSTEPQNKKGLNKAENKSKKKFTSTKLKATACAILAVAVGAAGTFCISGGLSTPKMTTRSLASAMYVNAINPKYVDRVTRAYTETEPPTEAPTEKPTEKTTQKATEKATEKKNAKEKATEKATEKTTEKQTNAPTDPKSDATESNTYTIPENTQNVQFGANPDAQPNNDTGNTNNNSGNQSTGSQNNQSNNNQSFVTDPVTNPPATEAPSVDNSQSYQNQWNQGYLMAIDNPDPNYRPRAIKLSAQDRDLACKIVMREMGNTGFIGTALVAQALRDAMNLEGFTSIQQVVNMYGYQGPTNYTPNQDAIDAVSFIFDQNGSAVQHRVLFFYATWITSSWHESQNFVCAYDCGYTTVRFFDRWY